MNPSPDETAISASPLLSGRRTRAHLEGDASDAPTRSSSGAIAKGEIKRQAGFALVWVLWSVTLISLIAVPMMGIGRADFRLAANHVERARAAALADGAVHVVLATMVGRPTSAFGVQTDGTVYAWHDGDADVFARITIEAGRIDLNAAPRPLLLDLARAAGLPADRASRVVDGIVAFRSGEEDLLQSRTSDKLLMPKDAPFQSVSELLGVPGVTRDVYEQLAPSLTVMSAQAQPTPAAAPPLVLAALRGAPPPVRPRLTLEALALGTMPRIVVDGTGRPNRNAPVYRIETAAVLPGGTRYGEQILVRILPGETFPFRVVARQPSSWLDDLTDPHAL